MLLYQFKMSISEENTNIRNSKSYRGFILENKCFKFSNFLNQVECTYCRQVFTCHVRSGVKSLKEHLTRARHIKSANLRENPKAQDSQKEFNKKMIAAFSKAGIALSVFENKEFRDFMEDISK